MRVVAVLPATTTKQCVVIGLQSTGEASTEAVLKTRGQGGSSSAAAAAGDDKGGNNNAETTSTDYISAPQQTLLRVIERCFPLPPRPRAMREKERKEEKEGQQAVSETNLISFFIQYIVSGTLSIHKPGIDRCMYIIWFSLPQELLKCRP